VGQGESRRGEAATPYLADTPPFVPSSATPKLDFVHFPANLSRMKSLPPFVIEHLNAINRLCRDLSVRELRLFGSAVTEHFDSTRSDIDFVVEFSDPDAPGIADRYMALADGLELIFQRPVDLVTRQAMKNPVFRQTVDSTSQSLYAA
jgi:predicted nucleotidyltransferase